MALVTIRRSPSVKNRNSQDEASQTIDGSISGNEKSRTTKSLNECYFANKGAALVAGGQGEVPGVHRRRSAARALPQPDIHHHLQSMFYLLRPEETLKMAVKLESGHPGRTRYLVVVCHGDEAALLGIDCNHTTTVGLVLRVLADTSIKLDGDGGFSVCVCGQQHIFKPVSVQAMWSALQTLHRCSGRARELNHFAGGVSHGWAAHYEARVDSDRSCLNEWHAMDCLESRRPPSPDSLRHKPYRRDETERVIKSTLKEIMMSVDLDEVTSKVIRGRLEDDLDMNLAEYKSFIDQEMLTILGQMDAPTEIFEHVYLGSEWNASNLEELQRNGVRHILNVTREIDNFFPGMFDYLNIRVYDDEKTDLLKHWDNTFKYINKAKNEGSKVLVHCKMGISRSASVVIAYAMKAYNWHFDRAWRYVKQKRGCIKPNINFLNQLETYQGILDAMKNKEKLQRSKSETNLKSPKIASKMENKVMDPTPLIQALTGSFGGRPRSWSPDTKLASELLPPTSMSLENLAAETRHMLMPCANGSYSVSPNQIIRLKEEGSTSVKHIVNEIENASSACDRKDSHRRSLRLSFGKEPEVCTKALEMTTNSSMETVNKMYSSPSKSHKYHSSTSETNKINTWDPGERMSKSDMNQNTNDIMNVLKSDSGILDLKSNKVNDNFSHIVDLITDNEEKRPSDDDMLLSSRQSSYSSFDSAVVPDISRHSSWGSYDTRHLKGQLLLRDEFSFSKKNSESSLFKKEEMQCCEKRSESCASSQKLSTDLSIISECKEPKQKTQERLLDITENERKFNETCAILKERGKGVGRGVATWCGRLSASAPTESWLRGGLRRRPASASHGDLPRADPPRVARPAGLVSNLKKEFEARSSAATKSDDAYESEELPRRLLASKHRYPASVEAKLKAAPQTSSDDLSVKKLVTRYDNHTCKSKCDLSCESHKGSKVSHVLGTKKCRLHSENESKGRTGSSPFRNSLCGVLKTTSSSERPPIAPNVVSMNYPNAVVSTVMSKAQNKKQLQHGKTHPLTRLNLNRSNNRCNNPVYNTM